MYSSPYFKDLDSDAKDSDSTPAHRTQTQHTIDLDVSQLQLCSVPTATVSVCFYGQILQVWSVALSRLHMSMMSQTDTEVTCSMQDEQVFRSGEMFTWPHRAGLSNKSEL